MTAILSYIQIIISVVLMVLILLQQSEASLGSAFGGSSSAVGKRTRRGTERIIFIATIITAILFALVSLILFIL